LVEKLTDEIDLEKNKSKRSFAKEKEYKETSEYKQPSVYKIVEPKSLNEKINIELHRKDSYLVNKDNNTTLERERRMTERNDNDDYNKEEKLVELDKSDLASIRSLFDDNLSIRPHSVYHNLNFENDAMSKNEEKVNNSMMESLKKNHKKPPHPPGLRNLLQNADKSTLNRIQNVLKNKTTKKLNYGSSSDGSN
jgi:hypothetical protein